MSIVVFGAVVGTVYLHSTIDKLKETLIKYIRRVAFSCEQNMKLRKRTSGGNKNK